MVPTLGAQRTEKDKKITVTHEGNEVEKKAERQSKTRIYPMKGKTPDPCGTLGWNTTPFKNNCRTGCFQRTKPSLTLASGTGEDQAMAWLL